MSEIINPGNKSIIINNSVDELSDEVVQYVEQYVPKQLLTKNFWDNFILGASMYGISVGYTGAL